MIAEPLDIDGAPHFAPDNWRFDSRFPPAVRFLLRPGYLSPVDTTEALAARVSNGVASGTIDPAHRTWISSKGFLKIGRAFLESRGTLKR